MRHSPRRDLDRSHVENGRPPGHLDEGDAYLHEIDSLASSLATTQIQAAIVGLKANTRMLARTLADRLIKHDGDDNGFALTAVAHGRIDPVVLDEWIDNLQAAVITQPSVGEADLADAMRLLARYIVARDVELQAREFESLKAALKS